MAYIVLTLPPEEQIFDGKQITFRAPCDCTSPSGIRINGAAFSFVDAMGNAVVKTSSYFKKDAMLSVILDVTNSKAYLQNTVGNAKTLNGHSESYFASVQYVQEVLSGIESGETPTGNAAALGNKTAEEWQEEIDGKLEKNAKATDSEKLGGTSAIVWQARFDDIMHGTTPVGSSNNVQGYTASQVGESGARNLIPYPYFYTTREVNGIVFTDNGDGTIHVKGTATASASYAIRATSEVWILREGEYTLSGCPAGGSFGTYRLQAARFIDGIITSYGNDYGSGITFEALDELPCLIQIVISSGTTIDATFKPMLELGKVTHDYVPYYLGGSEKAKTAENARTIEGFLIKQLYKEGRILTSADNMDTLFDLGVYYYTSADIPQNAPYQNASFVEVIRFNDNRQIQRVTRAGVSGYQTERVYSGTWQEWAYNLNDRNFNQYALPLKGGGTVEYTDFNGFKVKRNVEGTSGLVGIAFQNATTTLGVIGYRNNKLYRTDVSGKAENSAEILDTSNKPSGSYTGDGTTAERKIVVAEAGKSVGNVLFIRSIHGHGFVSPSGATFWGIADANGFYHYGSEVIQYYGGTLTFKATTETSLFFNGEGSEYRYEQL